MTPTPYIGVTGIVTEQDARAVLDAWAAVRDRAPGRRLMAGVLVSARTLRGEAVSSKRYPAIADAQRLLAMLAEGGAWPVVHYNTRGNLNDELGALMRLAPATRGVQLNVVQPAPAIPARLRALWPGVEVILQVNRSSIGDGSPASAHAYVAQYRSGVDHALLDLSGGTGRGIDREWATLALAVAATWERLGITPGIAGGFGPGCGPTLADLRTRVGPELAAMLSIDAESRLRVPVTDPIEGEKHQDRLDAELVRTYLRDAVAGLCGDGGGR